MKRSGLDHPKVKLLAELLNVEIWGAVGILEMLWHFTSKFAPQGDIGKYEDKVIARAVGWQRPTGERGVKPECKLSEALVRAGWLDSDPINRLVVHDWAEHADQQVRRKLASQKLDFVQLKPSQNLAKPEPEPIARASGPSSSEEDLHRGASRPQAAAAAAAASPPPKTNGQAAAPPRRLSFDEVVDQAMHELASEGHALPDKTIANEFGRPYANPAWERMIAAIRHAEPRIRSARKPAALARRVILDELKGA